MDRPGSRSARRRFRRMSPWRSAFTPSATSTGGSISGLTRRAQRSALRRSGSGSPQPPPAPATDPLPGSSFSSAAHSAFRHPGPDPEYPRASPLARRAKKPAGDRKLVHLTRRQQCACSLVLSRLCDGCCVQYDGERPQSSRGFSCRQS